MSDAVTKTNQKLAAARSAYLDSLEGGDHAERSDVDEMVGQDVNRLINQEFIYTAPASLTDRAEDLNVPTICVYVYRGKAYMRYNGEWYKKHPLHERMGLLKHEYLHLILRHCTTQNLAGTGLPHRIINIAMDLAINGHCPCIPKGGWAPGRPQWVKKRDAFGTPIRDIKGDYVWVESEFSDFCKGLKGKQSSHYYAARLVEFLKKNPKLDKKLQEMESSESSGGAPSNQDGNSNTPQQGDGAGGKKAEKQNGGQSAQSEDQGESGEDGSDSAGGSEGQSESGQGEEGGGQAGAASEGQELGRGDGAGSEGQGEAQGQGQGDGQGEGQEQGNGSGGSNNLKDLARQIAEDEVRQRRGADSRTKGENSLHGDNVGTHSPWRKKGNEQGDGDGDGDGDGQGDDTMEGVFESRLQDALRNAVKNANSRANGWGNTSAELRAIIEDFVNPTIPWQQILRNVLGTKTQANRRNSWCRLNTRVPYMAQGHVRNYLPLIHGYIDQSGSVGNDALVRFYSELTGLARRQSFLIYYFDTQVDESSEIKWKKGAPCPLSRELGGGTCFNAPTRHAMASDCDLYFIFTDGIAEQPIPSRGKRRVWVLGENNTPPQWMVDSRETIIQLDEITHAKNKIDL